MEAEKRKRGMFICFEGLDHCGKTTQIKKLQEYLLQQKHKVDIIQFPGLNIISRSKYYNERRTEIGVLINEYLGNQKVLDNTVIHMLFSINRWEFSQNFLEGKTIIVDRYAYSGVAFTAAKGYELEWCKNADRGLPEPDVIIYLEISEEEIAKRGDFGREIYEKQEFQKKVKDIYEKLIDENQSNFVRIDANQTIEAVEEEIRRVIEKEAKCEKQKEIKKLWSK